MSLMEGWEVSRDKADKYNNLMEEFPIGDPIITSRCKLDKENGFLIVSDNGFAWRIKEGPFTNAWNYGKKKWVRWHDVDEIIPKKNGQLLVIIRIRKDGVLNLDQQGNYKTKKWKLTLNKNKDEEKTHFKIREENFSNILSEIYNRNKVDINPATSDSKI